MNRNKTPPACIMRDHKQDRDTGDTGTRLLSVKHQRTCARAHPLRDLMTAGKRARAQPVIPARATGTGSALRPTAFPAVPKLRAVFVIEGPSLSDGRDVSNEYVNPQH